MKQEVLKVVEKLQEICKDRGLTLSSAESCTGGLICHYLTTIPGASTFFVAGVIAYSKEAKKRILGISPATILQHGIISEETAREMAEKMRILSNSGCSVSTTGNLGPEVLEGKEQGLVYMSASKAGKTISRRLQLTGDREANKEEATLLALMLLIELVEGK